MLKTLQFTNFKSWKDTGDLRLGKITGLFGTNSSGKTSIIQFLLMLKQTVESQDRAVVLDFGSEDKGYVNLGSIQDVVHRDKNGGSISDLSWTISWTLENTLTVVDPATADRELFSVSTLQFNATIMRSGTTHATSAAHAIRNIAYTFAGDDRYHAFGMKALNWNQEYELETKGYDIKRTQGHAWSLPKPIKCYGFPDQVNAYYQNASFLSQFTGAFQDLFDSVYYLGPLRESPYRQYTWGGGAPSDMGRRGENVVPALLASRNRKPIGRGRGQKAFSVEEYVAYWLKELKLIHDFGVKEISPGSNLFQVRVTQFKGGPEILISDVGFGVSQVLPVLALCYYVPDNSTILFEQPEIHLHPSVQAGLADVFIDAVQKRNIQIVVESHSEHLLLRLQRRIAEEQISADDAALYFCERTENESNARALELDEFGNITNWPEGFFGDEFAERSSMMRAITKRRAARQ